MLLITGATGFTGGHLAARLLAEGERVRVLVRHPDRLAPGMLNAEVCVGDIRDPDACARAVTGSDVVYHLAASYRETGFSAEDHFAVNLDGTKRLCDAAGEAGVRRFVFCSTVGVHGEVAGPPADEESPFAPTDPYQESKCEAERYVHGHGSPMERVVFRPSGIYGPGDTRLLKFFRLIARGRFFMIGDGTPRYHLTYIDDLVQGILLCGRHDRAAGEILILAGPEAPTLNEWADIVAQTLGVRRPRWHVPVWPFTAAAVVAETVCAPLNIRPPLFRRRMDFFTKNREFTTAKAKRVLGFTPLIGVREGMARTARWYQNQRLL